MVHSMAFTSLNFVIFFPLLAVVYFLIPRSLRRALLLLASYGFYINMQPVYAFLLAGITLVTFVFTGWMARATSDTVKRRCMTINIGLVLLPLLFFKYFVAINSAVIKFLENSQLRYPLPEISLFLPIGISFYTFMTIGYIVDVYNEEVECEKNLGVLALFISFFPLVLSGPIERAKNMLWQFKVLPELEYAAVVQGMRMMLWGYVMKLVIADRIGIYVDAIYANIPHHNGTTLGFAACWYPIQVYADLGGYSLIAIGTARVLGFNVIQNFRRPFFATSMAEFWRRWHISLIGWLTDYIYTPLSFSLRRYGIWGIVLALMLTFIISGIWHGAALTFIVWGVMQGCFLSIEALTNRKRSEFERKFRLAGKAWYVALGVGLTFVLFASSQVVGRSPCMGDALEVFRRICTLPGALFIGTPTTMIFGLIGTLILILKDGRDEFFPERFLMFENRHKAIRTASYAGACTLILLAGVFDGGQFIYFQF